MNFTPKFESDAKASTHEPVTKYMATNLITFKPDQDISEVIDIMLDKKISGAPVLNEAGELIGMLSEKDCLKLMIHSAYHMDPMSRGKVKEYMTTNVRTVTADKDVLDIANEFLNSNYRRFPVLQNGKLVGQVSRRDILRAAQKLHQTSW
jgi:CBS domain-containing protein